MHKMFTFNDTTGQCGDIIQHASGFMPYAHKKLGFNKPVGVNFISDPENAKNAFGKTGYYDPNKMEITIFVDKRHVKDILRSLSHELVHHTQNCRGEFDQGIETGDGYAQKDPHMRKMEAEAYLLGNGFLFRDYEDQLKENSTMIESLLNEKALDKLTSKIFEILKEADKQKPFITTGPPGSATSGKKLSKKKVVFEPEEKHPEGKSCDDVHKGQDHKEWEQTQKNLEEASKEKWAPEIDVKTGKPLKLPKANESLPSKESGSPEIDIKTGKPLKLPKKDKTNENWFKGNKDQLLFDRLIKKWAK